MFRRGTYCLLSWGLLTWCLTISLFLTERSLCGKSTVLPSHVTLPAVHSLPQAGRPRVELLPRLQGTAQCQAHVSHPTTEWLGAATLRATDKSSRVTKNTW